MSSQVVKVEFIFCVLLTAFSGKKEQKRHSYISSQKTTMWSSYWASLRIYLFTRQKHEIDLPSFTVPHEEIANKFPQPSSMISLSVLPQTLQTILVCRVLPNFVSFNSFIQPKKRMLREQILEESRLALPTLSEAQIYAHLTTWINNLAPDDFEEDASLLEQIATIFRVDIERGKNGR